MYRNMLISVSCDWETVKNVVTGNSSSKLDRNDRDGKFVTQSKMLNNSAYSRLGNKQQYFTTVKCSFSDFFINIFLIFAQNIDCGYTLEPPQF